MPDYRLMRFREARGNRHRMSRPQRVLWEALVRNRAFAPYRFHSEVPVRAWVMDFYCRTLRLCIEVDGPHHLRPKKRMKDALRDAILLDKEGIVTLRIPVSMISESLSKCLRLIAETIDEVREAA